jgi:hypothetical protein
VHNSAARNRRACGGFSSLDKAAASKQGRPVGLSCPLGGAMDAPVDESTPTAAKRLQQALEQRSRGRLRLDFGGS